MTVNTLIKLVDIPDYRFEPNCESLNYDAIATDCETKTVSLLEALNLIGSSIFNITDTDSIDKDGIDKIHNFACLIMDLSEVAIATNKIAQPAFFLSGHKHGEKNEK
ncbi:hypothetical protein [Cedecea sp. P7760]|uniref:hypothetical protein n=1 Tax=Cedecea sp. P7760 TaxID=2726983 RepID=UPI0015A258BE|nr:hypothetical protein [Cedecea sp. P7760]NWC65422.1 hypothetical protein [Cedecea sp. P7760]